ELFAGPVLGGKLDGAQFEYQSHIVELLRQVTGGAGLTIGHLDRLRQYVPIGLSENFGILSMLNVQKPVRSKLLNRLAQHNLADTEGTRQLRLRWQRIADLQPATDDLLREVQNQLLAQAD